MDVWKEWPAIIIWSVHQIMWAWTLKLQPFLMKVHCQGFRVLAYLSLFTILNNETANYFNNQWSSIDSSLWSFDFVEKEFALHEYDFLVYKVIILWFYILFRLSFSIMFYVYYDDIFFVACFPQHNILLLRSYPQVTT